jgi:hypothetical protein
MLPPMPLGTQMKASDTACVRRTGICAGQHAHEGSGMHGGRHTLCIRARRDALVVAAPTAKRQAHVQQSQQASCQAQLTTP